MDRWDLLRDIGTWGSGIALIFWEAHLAHPDEYVIAASVVLIAPRVYKHVKAVLQPHTGGRSSSPFPPPELPEQSGQESTDHEK